MDKPVRVINTAESVASPLKGDGAPAYGLRASGFGLRASGFGLRASGLIWYKPRRSCVLGRVEIQKNFIEISTANNSWCDFINPIVYAKHKR
ncbi:MAG: hypothetical protein LBQ31_00690 [Bacteroidales bacterium]|jgi:hypothetical protein|nr:hypothetical protein [Bacteroidales bacterium]